MAPHSSTLAWKIPWMEEPWRLQSMGLLGVGHDWATSLSLSLSCLGEGNGNPLQCSGLENPWDRGAWWGAVYGVTQSRTRLKRLSSSSSMHSPRILILSSFPSHCSFLLPKGLCFNLNSQCLMSESSSFHHTSINLWNTHLFNFHSVLLLSPFYSCENTPSPCT